MTNGTPSPARSSSDVSTTPEKSDKATPEKQTEKPTRPSLGRGLASNGVEQNAGTSKSATPERKTADETENSSISDLRKKLMESSESTSGINGERKSSVSSRVSSSRKSLTPDRRLDPIYEGPALVDRVSSCQTRCWCDKSAGRSMSVRWLYRFASSVMVFKT
ncbi:hypothetical protein ANCCAN_03407 [Ancylostoma caninum]|uniref:Uncharacterized protein n=1 Tax=Ancylostoma caninum TaxID=29170 RepID=A0A368H1Q8_ANCCA|nr:hypothetical protein ANCCAN_03407 [Ancylostoma caninum]